MNDDEPWFCPKCTLDRKEADATTNLASKDAITLQLNCDLSDLQKVNQQLLVEKRRPEELQLNEYHLHPEAPRPNPTRRRKSLLCNNRTKLSQTRIIVNKTKVSPESVSISTQNQGSFLQEKNHHENV